MTSPQEPTIHTVFESKTGTWQYIIADPASKSAIIIDSVLDFDSSTNTISTTTADALLSLVKDNQYTITKILETHAHADHLTASAYLQNQLAQLQDSAPDICIGKRISSVQERFGKRYGIPESEYQDVFDKLFDDDEVFQVGELDVKAVHLPGHTPDHMGYLVGANIFCGDSLFNTDVGSARCDFPGGDAHELYTSVQKLFSLPPTHRIYTGHDYPSGNRTEPVPYTTVADQKSANKHLKNGTTEAEFVEWRAGRDAQLTEPKLIHYALQFNIRAGRLPAPTEGGDQLLHVPVRVVGGESW